MRTVELYPTITSDIIKEAGIKFSEYRFSYYINGENRQLNYEIQGNQAILVDPMGIWNSKDYGIEIDIAVTIQDKSYLFGNQGVVSENSGINIALELKSKSSNYRKVKKCMFLDRTSIENQYRLHLSIDREKLVQKFTVEVLFSIVPNVNDKDYLEFANIQGMIIGRFNPLTALIEGKGAELPMSIIALEKGAPLWKVLYNSVEPNVEEFSKDYVNIIINSNHPDFNELDIENFEKPSALFKEVFSNALYIIMLNLFETEYWNDILLRNNFKEGSICSAISYFIETFDIDTSNQFQILYSIKAAVAKQL